MCRVDETSACSALSRMIIVQRVNATVEITATIRLTSGMQVHTYLYAHD